MKNGGVCYTRDSEWANFTSVHLIHSRFIIRADELNGTHLTPSDSIAFGTLDCFSEMDWRARALRLRARFTSQMRRSRDTPAEGWKRCGGNAYLLCEL